jgi:hypothetical protein
MSTPVLTLALQNLHISGIGLSIFGGILSTIYYFKPQQVVISVVFLGVISFVLGEAMALILPKGGFLGRLLNPHTVCEHSTYVFNTELTFYSVQ